MSNPNILDQAVRKNIIQEIGGSENIARKNFEQRKFDIYRNRQAQYVLERLGQELAATTVSSMRKVLSINPCTRIINQLGSIYAQEPERSFSGLEEPKAPADPAAKPTPEYDEDEDEIAEPIKPLKPVKSEPTEAEKKEKAFEDFYHHNGVDPQMRLANRYYKLCDQAALYIVPRNGKIQPRALTPKDYDVIPDADDPEKAFAYILNVFDVNMHGVKQTVVKEMPSKYNQNTKQPGNISNDSDRDRLLQRFVWWTAEFHFTTNGDGALIGEPEPNPIGRLPFIDIALEKDFQFFVRRGNNIAEFTIDLLSQLSDLAEISRLQGYSQAVIASTTEPTGMTVGPNKVIWLKLPASPEQPQPTFSFVSPTPDLANSLAIINTQLKMFLSSIGLDANTVTGDTPQQAFTSGIDHLLANIDKFKASQEDIDLFRRVETEQWDLMRAWSNLYQSVTGDNELDEELKAVGQISDEIEMEICFPEPALVETKKDKEDSTIKRWDKGLLTTKDALKEMYDWDDAKAEAYQLELKTDAMERPAKPGTPMGPDGKPLPPPIGGSTWHREPGPKPQETK